jgi:16S rRNA pseudouridine516 synthase
MARRSLFVRCIGGVNTVQLERLLRSQGFGSRPVCRALVESGRVEVGGECCDDPSLEIEPEGCEFSVDGEVWRYRKSAYLMLHKPANHECSHKPDFYPSVYSLLPRALLTRGVQAVGRLDADATGLLLFSDDGQFIHAFTSPKKKVEKVYEIGARHPVDADQVKALLDGVVLHDEPRPIAATSCEVTDAFRLRMSVTEGKYHLVKRMVAAAGNRVETLHRSAVGKLTLPTDLAAGEWRWLDADDLTRLGWGARGCP